ncbi:MAG: DUF4359 domain-containing protein [Synechococcaceae cyanobacterium ELA445]|jgi:hypothetical protein
MLMACGAAVLAGGALALTNPPPGEFELYAGERLVDLTVREVCSNEGLPMLLRMVLQNCPELVHNQRQLLGSLAAQHTRRLNFLLFSVYVTNVGGQELLPSLHLPEYHVTTLAAAGQFLQLEASRREVPKP